MNPRRSELVIAFVLRSGVWTCAAIISFGLLLSYFSPRSPGFSPESLEFLLGKQAISAPNVPHSLLQTMSGLSHLDPGTIIALGVMLLILLPILRVALAAGIFLLERDYLYMAVSLIVLAVLCSGLYWGKIL